jgi:hypothetical protein
LRGLGLTEAGIKVFEDLDSNEQRETATKMRNYERAYLSGDSEGHEEVVVSPDFTALLGLFKSSSILSSPRSLTMGDDMPTVHEDFLP